jgi:hypothetical protein
MIFLSKQGKDQYINMLAHGCGAPVTNSKHFDFAASASPVVLRGILNKVIKQCMQSGRKFYYMDSGYFGNNVGPKNPQGFKLWHRIVPNNLQHGAIVNRPRDRWESLGIDMQPRRHGTKIVIAVPDEKPCKFYNIDQQTWLNNTVAIIKTFTDRPIVVRQRAPRREDRVHQDPLAKVLADDVHALVTFNSVAATEAVILGVPAFVLAPCNAAAPVANASLDSIDNPFWPDEDLRQAWACHLAYGQCHVKELQSGRAKHIMAEQHAQ